MKIDEKVFWKRVRQVWRTLSQGRKDSASNFSSTDALLVWVDKNPSDDSEIDVEYSRSSMMSLHLFDGLEFPETLFVFTQKTVLIAASEKKIKLLEPCKGKDTGGGDGQPPLTLELVVRSKEQAQWASVADKAADLLKKSFDGKRVCGFIHKQEQGFGELLKGSMDKAGINISSSGLAAMEEAFSVKDDTALVHMKEACKKVCSVSEWFRKQGIPSLDDKNMSHEALVKKIDQMLTDDDKDLESARVTAVQSGTTRNSFNFSLSKWKSPKPTENVSLDVVSMRAGVSCKSYFALVGRTVFIDPSDMQKDTYLLLLEVRKAVVGALHPGAKASEVWKKAKEVVDAQSTVPRDAFFSGSVGYGVGLCFAETDTLSETNDRTIPAGATYVIDIRFENLAVNASQGNEKIFSCHFCDVVLVKNGGAEILTDAANVEWKKNHFRIAEDDEEEEPAQKEETTAPTRRTTRSQVRGQNTEAREEESKSKEQEMGARQYERMMKRQEEALRKARMENGEIFDGDGEESDEVKRGKIVNAYTSAKDFPPEWRRDRINVDIRRECVVLPIGDRLIPFHLSTIKSVTKVDEGADSSSLRFNFHFPTGAHNKDMSPEMVAAVEMYPEMTFIKELSFKSRDPQMVAKLHQQIKDLQKRARDKLKKENEEKDLVEQAELILLRDRPKERPATLSDVSMLPTLVNRAQQRCIGKLRAHVNGFRFSAERQGEVDILYNNVKYFFFQRGEKELKVLIHFYLKNPIMIGKKKTRHVQFFTEVQEGGVDLGGRQGDRFDPDEIEDEERHRRLVQKLNKMFAQFCKQSLEIARENNYSIGDDNEVEVCNTEQTRQKGFLGMPGREMVLIQPTQHCLVNLTEREFFVICVDEIEHVHLERVSIGKSKTFDVVFILKAQVALDHSGDTIKVVKIESVEMDSLDKVREWIHDHDPLTYTCSANMMNWDEVLKQVRYEMSEGTFWKDVDEDGERKDIGWLFLDPVGLQDEDEDEDDEDSSFKSSSEDDYQDGEEDDDSEDEDDSDDDLGSVVSDDDDDDEDADDDDEDEGEDWDELEKKAEKEDRTKKKKDAERDERERSSSAKKQKRG